MKGEAGHDRPLQEKVKRSSVAIKYSQVFPQLRVPSFRIGRLVHWVSANVEIHCLCMCASVRVFWVVCFQGCTCTLWTQARMLGSMYICMCVHVCFQAMHMENGSHVLVLPLCGLTDLPFNSGEHSGLTDLLYGDLHKWENRPVLDQLLRDSADFSYNYYSKSTAVCPLFIYRKHPRTEEKCHWSN